MTPDADPASLPFEPAPHIPMPQLLPHAGVVLSSVQLVTITFEDHAARADLEAFGDMIVRSTWYAAAGGEYGVQPGRHAGKIRLGRAPAAMTRDSVRKLIANLITERRLPIPPPAANQVLYLLYLPPSVSFADPELTSSVRGYHEMSKLDDGTRFPLAVVIDGGTGLAAVTVSAGHQLIESATNPYGPPMDGYYADPPTSDPWSLVIGEVADLCEGENTVSEEGFSLPRTYSNQAASAGKSPCKPFVPDDTWSDVTPRPSRMQMVMPGGSVTFQLTGWSTRELPDWTLRTQVAERSDLTEAEMLPEFSNNMINNKTSVTLTLHAPSYAQPGLTGGIYVLSGANVRPWAVGFFVK